MKGYQIFNAIQNAKDRLDEAKKAVRILAEDFEEDAAPLKIARTHQKNMEEGLKILEYQVWDEAEDIDELS